MKISVGDVFKTPGMVLRVAEKHGNSLKCEYYDRESESWKPRCVTENAKKIEQKIESGYYSLIV